MISGTNRLRLTCPRAVMEQGMRRPCSWARDGTRASERWAGPERLLFWVELRTPKRCAEALTPGTCEGDLAWKQGLCRCNHVKMKPYGRRMGPSPVGLGPHWNRQTEGRMPCEDGGRDWRMCLPTKEHKDAGNTRSKEKGRSRSSLDPSEGVLLSSLQPPELGQNTFLTSEAIQSEPPVMAALGNESTLCLSASASR